MTSASFAEMLRAAEAAGAVSSTLPKDRYTFKPVGANSGNTKAGDPKFGIQLEVVGGPQNGKRFWYNLQFVAKSPQNIAITFRTFSSLGIDQDFFAADPSPEQVKERILGIGLFSADYSAEVKNGYENIHLRGISLETSAPAAAAPQPQAPAPAFVPPAAAPAPAPADPAAFVPPTPATAPAADGVRTF
jgi:hypothetical protein